MGVGGWGLPEEGGAATNAQETSPRKLVLKGLWNGSCVYNERKVVSAGFRTSTRTKTNSCAMGVPAPAEANECIIL